MNPKRIMHYINGTPGDIIDNEAVLPNTIELLHKVRFDILPVAEQEKINGAITVSSKGGKINVLYDITPEGAKDKIHSVLLEKGYTFY